MIEPGELYRHFIVREIATGREWWILGGDTRYEVAAEGTLWGYRSAPDGEYFLVDARPYPCGRPMRLEEVEPLPDGRGMYHPDHIAGVMALQLRRGYEGSWRQYADSLETVQS